MYDNKIALHFDWSGMCAQCMHEKVLGGEIFIVDKVQNFERPVSYWIIFRQNLNFPISPIKHNKLLFANGTNCGWYWFEEITSAKEYEVEILSVEKAVFTEYYDFF